MIAGANQRGACLAGIACIFVGSLLIGCSAGAGAGTTDGGSGTFVAFASDFTGFHSWSSTPGVGPPGAPQPPSGTDGGVHAGPLMSYINQRPAKGSTSFPVGTIIVKEPTTPALTDRQIFAMVKRGGGYDSTGATDWEWFELRDVDANDVTIVWRGVGPPGGEAYGATPTLCNDCHAMARGNDFVWTAGLDLSSF
ncbi:MAG TPA: hypothetical protein VN894_03300 [Polyangiaceae bacterium]|nr:hypothetical protein [Polyangiaceae bacterium]